MVSLLFDIVPRDDLKRCLKASAGLNRTGRCCGSVTDLVIDMLLRRA